MPDVNIKISVDPATGAVAVTSDAGGGPAPGEISAGEPSAADAGAAPGPASEIVAGVEEAELVGDAPAPLDPSQLGADVAAAGTAMAEAAPSPEDLDVGEEEAFLVDQGAPEPMALTDLEREAKPRAKPKAKAKPKPKQTRTKKS